MRAFRCLAVVHAITTGASCADPTPLTQQTQPPAWVGSYALVADSAVTCTETTTASGRTCDCQPPGHYEGTLTLASDSVGVAVGTLTVSTCLPGQSCMTPAEFPIRPYIVPPPPPGTTVPSYWLAFCAGVGCPYGGNGGWAFRIPAEGASLVGHYVRDDGNVRGCGADLGPFVATRQ